MYKVVRKFKDKDGHIYEIGDDYPALDAKKQSNARFKSLYTAANKYNQIYIKKIEVE